MTIKVEGDLDLHTFLGLADSNAGFSGLSVSVDIETDANQDALDELHSKVTGSSPVGHTLSRSVPIDVTLHGSPGANFKKLQRVGIKSLRSRITTAQT